MKKTWILILAAVLLIAGATAAYFKSRPQTKRAERAQTVEVQKGTLEEAVEATGGVQPLNRVEIKPPISGRIEQLKVDEGATVKAGQILGWMSSTDRAAILDAALAKGDAEVKRWEDAYKPTPIIAPLSGRIILKNVVVGQTIDASTVLYAMSDKLIVKADVDETDIGRIKVGMPAVITLDSYPNDPIDGSVFQILHEGVNVSNVITYGVKIEPKNVPPFFRSLMTANIKLIANKKEDVLTLPAAAVTSVGGGEKQVTVPGPDGKPVKRTVETGLESGDSVEIVSGLQEGDKVLVFTRRYVPQQAAGSSPLVMGGNRRSGQGQGQSGQGGQGGNRRSGGSN
jgi:membrane fusion protein, macrolide-specific efflux system